MVILIQCNGQGVAVAVKVDLQIAGDGVGGIRDG